MSDIRTLSNRELQTLGDQLDHQVPGDLIVRVIEEQRQRTIEQQEIAEHAIASNRKRRALRQALAANPPTVIAPLDPEVLAQMRRDQADQKARRRSRP